MIITQRTAAILVVCLAFLPAGNYCQLQAAAQTLEPNKIDGTPCESAIFCHGDLLSAVQLAGIFSDSKEFVDRPLHVDPEVVLRDFSKLGRKPSPAQLEEFVTRHFAPLGHDLEKWVPEDWKEPAPLEIVPLLANIADRSLRDWAVELHGKWREFGRKTASTVAKHPGRHSLITLPHPFIVNKDDIKGRFREQHYYDAYWIVHGLLISGMNETAKGMILNFASLVDRFGYVPVANRVYYQKRPQPPMLAAMVNLYWLHGASDANELVKEVLPAIEKEYSFWITSRSVDVTVNGRQYTLNRFKGTTTKPRPESYREDLGTARSLRNRSALGVEDQFFANIAAASESGWEFSTRWLDQPTKSLAEIRTEDIIPVDLNAFLCLTERHLSFFHKTAGDDKKASDFRLKANRRGDAMHAVFWNEKRNMWRDFDLRTHKQREQFYLSHITPLFAGCSPNHADVMSTEFLQRIAASEDLQKGVFYPGFIPVSFVGAKETCQSCQWDFPNTWPSLQLLLIEAFAKNTDLKPTALIWSQKMISAMHGGYMSHGQMFEKYNVNKPGFYGDAGEYVVQDGYAPTNGAVLRLLELFPKELHNNDDPTNNEVYDKEYADNGQHALVTSKLGVQDLPTSPAYSEPRLGTRDDEIPAQVTGDAFPDDKKATSVVHRVRQETKTIAPRADLSKTANSKNNCQSSYFSAPILFIFVISLLLVSN